MQKHRNGDIDLSNLIKREEEECTGGMVLKKTATVIKYKRMPGF